METDATQKPATQRQMAYIQRLQKENGIEKPEVKNEISRSEASGIIKALIVQTRQNGALNGQVKINEPRLGMAMKECFKLWTGYGRDIWEEKRKAFIEETIETYNLFTEIAEKMDQNSNSTG